MKIIIFLLLVFFPLFIHSQNAVLDDWAFVKQTEHFAVEIDSFIKHERFEDGFSRVPKISEFLGLSVLYTYYKKSGEKFIDIIIVVVLNQEGLAEAMIKLFGACEYDEFGLGYRYVWKSNKYFLSLIYNENGTSTITLGPSGYK